MIKVNNQKAIRQSKIIEIIKEKEIKSQKQLIDELEKNKIITTQATISQDIKDLKLIKIPSSDMKSYKYAINDDNFRIPDNNFLKSIIDIKYNGNIIVIKTLSGAASAVAEVIDLLKCKDIVGTVAGDNTVFILVRKMGSLVVEEIFKDSNCYVN
ncbi:arginine repressor (plasmid) [Thermoanaerobacterium thermosaccharolyticum]|uniref:arginine repressor n=1 Tax=Thermoanaerobacterium thermosaccharolyticum TaxID=1517 RepID=UPI003DA86642